MKPLCVLVAGDTVERARARGDFYRLIRETTGEAWPGPWASANVGQGEACPTLESVAGVIVSGSPASVTERLEWMLRAEAYLREAVQSRSPVFGICFGHQMLASALGGRVERNPNGREMGTVAFDLVVSSPLFDPTIDPRLANETHVDSVVVPPPGAVTLARTARDPFAALRFGERAWGVQFHPEFDGEVMRLYLEGRRAVLESEGHDPDAMLAAASDAEAGTDVLRAFARSVAREER